MIIKAAKRTFNSDKICRSYSDLNFGVTFFGTQCILYYIQIFTVILKPTKKCSGYPCRCCCVEMPYNLHHKTAVKKLTFLCTL